MISVCPNFCLIDDQLLISTGPIYLTFAPSRLTYIGVDVYRSTAV